MSQPQQRLQLMKSIWKELIPLCCNGINDAENYLKQSFYIIRMIDDIYDEDYPVHKEEIIRGYFYLMTEIPHNPFYQKHSAALNAVNLLAFNAWQNSNNWYETGDHTKKLYAHVLRDYVCELFILVAYLTGGEDTMKNVNTRVREIFLKEFNSN